jgi:hypothetical protein
MKNNRFFKVMAVMAFAITLVFAGCSGKNDGGNSSSGGGASANQLSKALDAVLSGGDEAAAVAFAEVLKNANSAAVATLNSKASPGGDFTYDLNETGDGIIITKYTGSNPVLIIPAEIEGYPVREININHTKIIAAVIPENVQIIGSQAFMYASKLASVSFPKSLVKISSQAFLRTTALSSIDLSHTSLTTIGREAFNGDSKLQSVKLPDSVIQIGHGAFLGCKALTDINIPASIQTIYAGAFSGDVELFNLTIPDSITGIEFTGEGYQSAIFRDCGKLPLATRQRLKDLGYKDTF